MFQLLFDTLLGSSPYIVLGFLIAGFIRTWIPQGILHRHLGGKPLPSLLKSVGVGCILPLCSCGTIPLGIGLYRSGAAIGNMLAFMTSTPVLSPVLIIFSMKMLGVKLTGILVLSTVIGAFFMGGIGNRFFKNKQPTVSATQKYSPEFTPEKQACSSPKNRKVAEALRWSFFDLGADVSFDILIGLSIASFLLAVLPIEWVSNWLGQQDISTLFYVVLLGIPVYACSLPSIAVVQGLLMLGATPGAAVAYMIAGPATNLGELNAIGKSMGKRPAVFYAASLIILALSAGVITDRLIFPNYEYHAFRVQGELFVRECCAPVIFGDTIGGQPATTSVPAWYWPFGVILFVVIVLGVVKKLRFFFINPCKSCTWKAYGKGSTCGAKCHVRRKYEFVRRLIPGL